MNVDAGDLAKIAAALGGLGAGFAVVRPFAEQLFKHWLERADKEQAAKLERERAERDTGAQVLRALQGSAVAQEKVAGVLDSLSERIDAVVDRLDALMLHHGVNIQRLSPAPPPVNVRATLTGLGAPGATPAAAQPAGAGGSPGGSGSPPSG